MIMFLHIGITFADRPQIEELEPVFNKAIDWLRYAANCWIVKTRKPPRVWLKRLRSQLATGDHVLIVQINPSQRSGLLPKWAWEWLAAQSKPQDNSSSGAAGF